MRDEIDGRIWSAHHDQLSADLHALVVKIGDTFARLHPIHWSAPWRGDTAAERRQRTGHA